MADQIDQILEAITKRYESLEKRFEKRGERIEKLSERVLTIKQERDEVTEERNRAQAIVSELHVRNAQLNDETKRLARRILDLELQLSQGKPG